MDMTDFGKIGALIVGGLAIFGVGCLADSRYAERKRQDRMFGEAIQKRTDEYLKTHPIDIPQGVVNDAINRNVRDRITVAVDQAKSSVVNDAKSKIGSAVADIFAEQKAHMAEDVAKRFQSELFKTNRDDIRDAIVDKVRDIFEDKMLDEVLPNMVDDAVDKQLHKIVEESVRNKSPWSMWKL